MKLSPALAVRLAAFVVGACVSYKYMAGYWVIGPVFGAVVLFWYADSPQKAASLKVPSFFLASTLIWALVFWMSGKEKISHQDILVPVAAGSVLLPLAHMFFLNASLRRTLIAVPVIYGVFFVSYRLTEYFHTVDRGVLIQYSLNVVVAWQAAYLACMFFNKKGPVSAAGSGA